MKTRNLILFLFALALLLSCSRESGIARNPLLGKHPVVFLLREDPGDIEAFIDSVLELPGDSVVIPDTVNATIDDTIWCVGYFGGTTKAVASYRWKVTGKAELKDRRNRDVLPITFDSVGVFQAKFMLRDNLNAADSAGGTQYIRIIDTDPLVHFVGDTAYSKSKGPADFYFFATDTFGRISEIQLDYDMNGKWDTTITWTGGDSIPLSIVKGSKVDTAGNQKIVVSITDDDGNASQDTLILHFNRPPTISLTYPLDSSKVNILERLAFYWDAKDSDNPGDLRYTLQVGSVTPLTSKHTRAANLNVPTWELIDSKGNREDSTITGNLYWRVIATDGLDTVTSDSYKFFLGDPSVKYGVIHGVIRMQGSTRYDGVRVTLINLNDGARLMTITNPVYKYKGDFHFTKAIPGCYRLDARDTTGLFYSPVTLDSVCVELGDTLTLDTLWLMDHSKPRIVRNSILDTLYTTRSISISGIYADSGSLVDTASLQAWLGTTTQTVTRPEDGKWNVNLTNVPDGVHNFKIVLKDNAGNVSDTLKATFKVKALQINFVVNGENAVVVRAGGAPYDTLKFRVTLSNANPAIDSVLFDLKGDGSLDRKIKATTGQTSFAYDTSAQNMAINDTVRIAVLHVKTAGLTYLDTVSYRIRNRASAGVIFTRPGKDTTVTLQDAISLVIQADASEGNTINRWQWDIDGNHTNGTAGYELDYNASTPVTFPATAHGTFKLRVKITDTGANTSFDSVTVTVVSQPPTVQATVDRDTTKINGDIPLSASATDIAPGTIALYEWKCGTDAFATAPGGNLTLTAPATVGTTSCVVRVTDNDGEYGYDTVTVLVKQDKPYVRVLTDSLDVTIRDQLQLKALAVDTLGEIAKIEWSCAIPGSANWKTVSKTDTTWTAPAVKTNTYYCAIRVTDDDGQTAMDTTKYRVKEDRPYVKVFEDSLYAGIGDVVSLNAIVIDTLGSITRIVWICGNSGIGDTIEVGSPLYDHTLPTTSGNNYMCIIQAEDDDGTRVSDTTKITIDQDLPTVSVKKEIISTRVNEQFFVDCIASDKFGDTDFRWRCGAPTSLGSWSPMYENCGVSRTAPATGTDNYICIVEVTDEDDQKAYDTLSVLVVQPPEAILTNTTQLAIWSGDIDIPEEARYWHYDINGASSIIGVPLGDANNRDYWWQFSHLNSTDWLNGLPDGTLDQNYEGFDSALVRLKAPGTIQVRLDFRDSILPTGETDPTYIYDFYVRHLDYDSVNVEFKRYWVNQGTDTVIQKATRAVTVVSNNNGPIAAYRESVGGLGYVKKFTAGAWSIVGGGDFGGGAVVDSVRLARDPANEDLYVAYRNTTGNITVKRSATGTGNWTTVGGGNIAVNGNNARRLSIAAKSGKVAVAWVGNDSIVGAMTSISTVNGGAWGWGGTSGAVGAIRGTNKDVDVTMAFNTGATDTLAFLALSTGYTTRIRLARDANLGTLGTTTDVTTNSDAISIGYAANGQIFVAYNNRTQPGSHVVRMASNALGTKTHLAGFGLSQNVSVHPVGRATSLAIGTDNQPYLAYDDNFFAPQVNVWKYTGTAWKLHGENLLPHFKDIFYQDRGYYLQATSPSLSVAPNGTVYIGMIGLDKRGASAANNGPIVMKYTP